MKLHRIHASQQATRLELNAIGMHWRGEGGTRDAHELKEQIAYRFALCWNVLEGVPNGVIEGGWLRDLCEAVLRGDLEHARAMVVAVDVAIDRTGGRVHDCEQCLEREAAITGGRSGPEEEAPPWAR